MIRVSIIIPVYNQEKYIEEALSSVFQDPFSLKEIIVIDDGSTDSTFNILSKCKEINLLKQKNRGVSVARNVGIKKANGEFITFLDGDDIWVPGRINACLEIFESEPETDIVLGQEQVFLQDGIVRPSHLKQEWFDRPRNACNNGVMFVRKECFHKIGLFNPELKNGEDTDWILRGRKAGLIERRIEHLFHYRRIHGTNLSLQSKSEIKQNLLGIIKKNLLEGNAKKTDDR